MKGLLRNNGMFADIQMPVMDGIEAVRRLRVHEMESGVERSNRQLIIGISANGKSEIEANSLAVGMNGFIPVSAPCSFTTVFDFYKCLYFFIWY